MQGSYRIRAGQIIGRDHSARQANAQDSYAMIQTDNVLAGVVCDGCGSGQHSEVGSTLAAQYIVSQINTLIEAGYSLEAIPTLLYGQIVDYLAGLVALSAPVNAVGFVEHHLLFTILGVILTEQGGLIFSAGDGLIAVDESVTTIDQHNKPAYIAYHLIREHVASLSVIQHDFDVCPIDEDWQRIVIATDGFEAELLPQLRDLQHPRSLQRKLNVWSNQERRFRDDATLIVIEKEDAHAGED